MSSSDWDVESMPDQSGRTIVVTGANSGLGYEATKAFAAKGAHVVMACRSLDRGHDARDDIQSELSGASLTVMELDLADLDSVESFATKFRRDHNAVHVLCNNAGVMAIPRDETVDGFEKQFGVNHLGHYALTGHLLEPLRNTAGETRVVTHSSNMHERGKLNFEDLHGDADYGKWDAYAQSKLANLLFAYELDRRLRAGNASVSSVACHPGYADTNLQRRGPEQAGSRLRLWGLQVANRLFAQSPAAGALPMLYAATAPDVDGGQYYGPGGFMNMRGTPEQQESSPRSYDETTARRLWTVSQELTGVGYDLPIPPDSEGDTTTAEP